jgi:hypothetical protein
MAEYIAYQQNPAGSEDQLSTQRLTRYPVTIPIEPRDPALLEVEPGLRTRDHLAALPLRAAAEGLVWGAFARRDGSPLTAPPIPRRNTLRFREAPEAKLILTGMGLVIEERLVVEIPPVDPGVALANHLAIDVPIADPDVTYCATVAIGVHDAHLGLFAIHLVGQRLLGPRAPRLAALGGVDFGKANLDRAFCHENGDRIAVCDANDLARERLGSGDERENEKE